MEIFPLFFYITTGITTGSSAILNPNLEEGGKGYICTSRQVNSQQSTVHYPAQNDKQALLRLVCRVRGTCIAICNLRSTIYSESIIKFEH